MKSATTQTFTATSPASPSTTATAAFVGLEKFDSIRIDATLTGATGGTLDVYLQRLVSTGPNVWVDWVHFPQIPAAQAAKSYSLTTEVTATVPVVVGIGTDAAPGVALAANTSVGGHPGQQVRVVFVAGASTTAGATQTIYLVGQKNIT